MQKGEIKAIITTFTIDGIIIALERRGQKADKDFDKVKSIKRVEPQPVFR